MTGATARKFAGGGTVAFVLQTVSAVLLIVLLVLFVDIARQYRIMEDGVRENSLWSVYQLDREVRQLSHSLSSVRHDEQTPQTLDELALRYDILYSRVSILDEAKFGTYFSGDEKIRGYIAGIRKIVLDAQPIFDAYSTGARPTPSSCGGSKHRLSVWAAWPRTSCSTRTPA